MCELPHMLWTHRCSLNSMLATVWSNSGKETTFNINRCGNRKSGLGFIYCLLVGPEVWTAVERHTEQTFFYITVTTIICLRGRLRFWQSFYVADYFCVSINMPRNNTQKHLKRSKIGGGGRFVQSIVRFFVDVFHSCSRSCSIIQNSQTRRSSIPWSWTNMNYFGTTFGKLMDQSYIQSR